MASLPIPYQHWQMRVSRATDPIGAVVVAEADLDQAVRLIIATEKGSVPIAPEKCCRLMPYVDRRPDWAIPYLTREIVDALNTWEPRIKCDSVTVTWTETFGQFRVVVRWYPIADVTRRVRETIVGIDPQTRGLVDAA